MFSVFGQLKFVVYNCRFNVVDILGRAWRGISRNWCLLLSRTNVRSSVVYYIYTLWTDRLGKLSDCLQIFLIQKIQTNEELGNSFGRAAGTKRSVVTCSRHSHVAISTTYFIWSCCVNKLNDKRRQLNIPIGRAAIEYFYWPKETNSHRH